MLHWSNEETDLEYDARHRRSNRAACLWCIAFGLLCSASSIIFGVSAKSRPDLAAVVEIEGAFALIMVFVPLGVLTWGGWI